MASHEHNCETKFLCVVNQERVVVCDTRNLLNVFDIYTSKLSRIPHATLQIQEIEKAFEMNSETILVHLKSGYCIINIITGEVLENTTKVQRALEVLSSTQFVVLEYPNLFQTWDITSKKLTYEFELAFMLRSNTLDLVHVCNSMFCAMTEDGVYLIDAQVHTCVPIARSNYLLAGKIDHYLYTVTTQNFVRVFNTRNNFNHVKIDVPNQRYSPLSKQQFGNIIVGFLPGELHIVTLQNEKQQFDVEWEKLVQVVPFGDNSVFVVGQLVGTQSRYESQSKKTAYLYCIGSKMLTPVPLRDKRLGKLHPIQRTLRKRWNEDYTFKSNLICEHFVDIKLVRGC